MIKLNNAKQAIWKHIGPKAEETIAIPPIFDQLSGYVLVYDKNRQTLVYVFIDDNQVIHAWEWDGNSWSEFASFPFPGIGSEYKWSGYYHSFYKGVAIWCLDILEPIGIVFGVNGVTCISTRKTIDNGNNNLKKENIIECRGELPLFSKRCYNKQGIFGYDEMRETTICITDIGVWELSKEFTWERKFIIPEGLFPGKCSGWYDSGSLHGTLYYEEMKCTIVWLIDMEEIQLRFYTWDGINLKDFNTFHLPELNLGHRHGIAFCTHPQYNIVFFNFIKNEAWYLKKENWERLEIYANLHLIPEGLIAYNPVTQEMMTGPGKGPGKYNNMRQHVFYLFKNGDCIKQGVIKNESLLNDTYTWYLNVVSGKLYATSQRTDLRTAVWDEKSGWTMLVNENDAKEVFKGKTSGKYSMSQFLIGKNGFLYAISDGGGVYMFDTEKWNRIALEWTDFKERNGICAGYDPDNDRIIVWGGTDNKRKNLNDSFIFENGNWLKFKKTSPIPYDIEKQKKDIKKKSFIGVDFCILYDTVLKTFVRFGYENVAVLNGEIWVTYKPGRYKELVSASQRCILHDPLSGETLIINRMNKESVVRFNLDECCMIGSYSLPEEYVNNELNKRWFEPYFAFCHETRTLHLHDKENDTENYTLDLSPVFDYAASLGNRHKIDIN